MSVYTDNDNRLCCPLCGDNKVWINRIERAAGGPGDGPDWRPPTPEEERFSLVGLCGNCIGQFALVFSPHISESVTFVESVDLAVVRPVASPPDQRFVSPDTDAQKLEDV